MDKQPTTKGIMKLKLIGIIERLEKHSPMKDERRKVNSVIASYRGEDGHEYRKRFNSYSTPNVPVEGTHKELNALENQWGMPV